MTFFEQLTRRSREIDSLVCVGLDPDFHKHRVEDVATPAAFARDPDLVHRFYDMRRERIQAVEPNAAHHALARVMRRAPASCHPP